MGGHERGPVGSGGRPVGQPGRRAARAPTGGAERVSVIIPAYNEARRIEKTIRAIAGYMSPLYERYEIVVSDDGSVDGTGAIVTGLRAEGMPITLVRAEPHRGKGSAVRLGVAVSTGDLVLVTDADLATPIEEFEKLLARLCAGDDIVIGSRGLRDSRLVVRQPFYREWMGRFFNLLVQLVLLPGIYDTQCGFKLFRGPVARRLFAHCTIDGFAFDVEVLSLAARAAYRIGEVPVPWAHMNDSKVSLGRDGLGMFRDMLRVAYRLRAGWYDVEALTAPVEAPPATVPERT